MALPKRHPSKDNAVMTELSQRSTRLAVLNEELLATKNELAQGKADVITSKDQALQAKESVNATTLKLGAAETIIAELDGQVTILQALIKDKPTLDALGLIKSKIKAHRDKL